MSIDDELKVIVLENAKGIRELRESIKEEMKESKREFKEEMKEFRTGMEELRESQRKTDEQLRTSQKKLDELSETVKKVSKIVGGIGNNQGDVAEEFFYNSLSHKPSLAGIDYDFIDKNITRKKDNIEDEYDILLINGKDIAIIETKYKAHDKDLERLLEKKYINFKKLYPEYKDYNHHLGLATFKINDELKQKALDSNVMILQRKGEIVETTLP